MTLADLLSFITRVFFILLGVVTLIDFLRRRDRTHLNIALMFGSLATPVTISLLTEAIGIESSALDTIGSLALVAQPYLLLRLVDHFEPVPPLVERGALLGLIASEIILIVFPSELPPLAVLLIIGYFVSVDGYAVGAFIRGALSTRGVVQQRLRFAAGGSGLLAGALLLIGVSIVIPAADDLVGPLTQLIAIFAALSYYLAFVPPHWLRRVWQLDELYRFLGETIERPVAERAAEALDHLCESAARAVGAVSAVVALWDEAGKQLKVHNSGSADQFTGPLTDGDDLIGHTWRDHRPRFAFTPGELGVEGVRHVAAVGADGLYAVPIGTARHSWGLLLIFVKHGSLFAEDDLRLLTLFAEQSAMALEYTRLLEQIGERTAQLERANAELEAFSYSVSHDLRAPLRSIDGFSQAVLEDYADDLDAEAKSYLERVRAACQRMGQLIDDLLKLAYLRRQDLHIQPVDLSRVARQISAELQDTQPERKVDFVIEDGLLTNGDARLLRAALENLLNNAWKFTSTKPHARIELGYTSIDGQNAYYVRDNGAGFDMDYADKLFRAFHRLHGTAEFEGVGVGLATVQRIIERHDGEIWAEGAVDQGATFYFTLAAKPD